jgi:hypothetical protein
MSETPVGPLRDGEAPAVGEASRIALVLLQPARVFRAIAAKPTWLLALLLTLAVNVGVRQVVAAKLDPNAMRPLLEKRGLSEQKIEEVLAQQTETRPLVTGLKIVGGAVMTAIFLLLAVALFWTMCKLMGSELSFAHGISVTLHGLVPLVLAGLLAVPVILSRESISYADAMSGNLLASHAGVFAGEDAGLVTSAALSSIDIFSIWAIVLLVMGFSIVGRISKTSAAVAVLVPWLLGIGLKLGFLAFLSSFMGL